MIIKALSENTCVNDQLGTEHGLSLYIKTASHRILFDTGASGLFASNADKLGVDLFDTDIAVISHGHHDHGGGLAEFFKRNSKAPVFIGETAFGDFYANFTDGGCKYIGLDISLQKERRFVCVDRYHKIDESLALFSGVDRVRLNPSGNSDLLVKRDDAFDLDNFRHEVNLLIMENGKTVLLAGCAHSGIVNILEHIRKERGFYPDIVIGGFHLYNPAKKVSENEEIVRKVGAALLETGASFYTCHCTGLEAFAILKDVMGSRLDYLSAGAVLEL